MMRTSVFNAMSQNKFLQSELLKASNSTLRAEILAEQIFATMAYKSRK